MQRVLPVLLAGVFFLASCGGGGGGSASPSVSGVQKYQVSGTLTGLSAGAALALSVDGQSFTLSRNGGFDTPASLAAGAQYSLTVVKPPAGEACAVTNGSGTIGAANVTDVLVACTTNPSLTYRVGGSVSGLNGALVLKNNGTDSLTIGASGAFTFSTALFDQASYDVTVVTQPAGQTCTVTNAAGTVQGANVANVQVDCANNPPPTITIGGSLSGLAAGTGLILQDNGGDDLTLAANGSFSFPTPVPSGSPYAVTLAAQPANQTCSVANGTSTAGGSNVTNVQVTCAASSYAIGGTVTGLASGASLVLQDNGGDNLALTADGWFYFSQNVTAGSGYGVTVLTQPNQETCTVANGSGVMGGSNVTNVAVSCTVKPQYLYVANLNSNDVSAYRIDASTGALTLLGSFPAGTQPDAVAVNPAGTFAYVANNGGGVSVYRIDAATGVLSQIAGSPFAAGTYPISVTVDPAGTFAYVANNGSGTVSAYRIDQTTGALTQIPGSPFAAGAAPYSITVDPAGTFAYVANNGSGTVSAYRIDATTGALASVGALQVGNSATSTPTSVSVNPAGTFAYAVGRGSGNVSAYRIDQTTGALAQISGSPFAAGTDPYSVTINPAGTFAYVADRGGNDVSAYSIDAPTGVLVPIGTFATGTTPVSIAINPAGTFAYVANSTSNDVSAYSIDAPTGVLVPVGTFAAGSSPYALAVAQR